MQKLFISFSRTLYLFREGSVQLADLDNALFYFGCTREHAHKPGASGEHNEVEFAFSKQPEEGERIHRALVEALIKAENEGRASYRKLDEHNTYNALNALLSMNGHKTIDTSRIDTPDHYNYPTVVEAIAEQKIDVELCY